jgi:hypothetical protein
MRDNSKTAGQYLKRGKFVSFHIIFYLLLYWPTFLILKKMKVSLCDHHAVYVSPLLTLECRAQSL